MAAVVSGREKAEKMEKRGNKRGETAVRGKLGADGSDARGSKRGREAKAVG